MLWEFDGGQLGRCTMEPCDSHSQLFDTQEDMDCFDLIWKKPVEMLIAKYEASCAGRPDGLRRASEGPEGPMMPFGPVALRQPQQRRVASTLTKIHFNTHQFAAIPSPLPPSGSETGQQ